MKQRLFEDLIESDVVAHKTKQSYTLPVSLALHAVLFVLVLIVPLLTSQELPEPTSAVRAFFVEPAPPPPPPPPPTDGTIGLVGSTWNELSTARSSITIQRPAGSAAGDVLVAAIASNHDTTIDAPNGWTAVRQDVLSGAVRQSVYLRIVGSSEPSSYTWTLDGTRRVAGGISAYTGVDTARPIDAVDGSLNPVSTAVPAPEITTSVPNAMVVQLVAVNAEGTLTPPRGMTEAWEAASPNPNSDRDVLMSSSHAAQGLAGPTGVRVATASSPGASIGVLLALRPAG